MTLSPEYRIYIAPIGTLDESLLRKVRMEIGRMFGYNTKIIRLLQDLEFALNKDRDQYHSTSILEKLASQAPPNAIRVIAIVDVDLYIPILTHVFGEAQLGGKAAVVSTHRLKESVSAASNQDIYHRIPKEVIHELGHTFGLRHCRDHTCIMHYCRTLRDVDRKSEQLCRYCKILVEDEIKRLAKKKPPAQ